MTKLMPVQNEKIMIYYSQTYNTRIEYYGIREDIRQFFRLLDIWNSNGELKKNIDDDQYYLFELPKEFYTFAKTDSFMYAMRRNHIDIVIIL